MTQTIVNLALPVVATKVEEILTQYPTYPHQHVFNSIDWRQRLVSYVLGRMPSVYTAMDATQFCSAATAAGCYSMEQQHYMVHLIHQGIAHLVSQQRLHPETYPQADMASAWFG